MKVVFLVMVLSSGLVASCAPADEAENVCDPGKTDSCSCVDGASGSQVCAADGSIWEECVCGESDDVTIEETSDSEEADKVGTPGKLCNGVTKAGESTSFTLVIGEGADAVELSANTDECSTPRGEQCIDLPTGTNVPISLTDDDTGSELITGEFHIIEGERFIFLITVGDGGLTVESYTLKSTATCDDWGMNDF